MIDPVGERTLICAIIPKDTTHTNGVRSIAFKIFNGNFFKIPDYQRGYAWTQKEVIALLKDIENLYGSNHMHFTGTIVAAKDVAQKHHYDIVDGQQRMTTMIIIISELLRVYANDGEKHKYLQIWLNEKFGLLNNYFFL